MPVKARHKTKYVGVYWIDSTIPSSALPDKIYYIVYRKDGKLIEEKAGRAFQGMTPARASNLRSLRIAGKQPSNKERREEKKIERWTIKNLWRAYKEAHPALKGIATDESRFQKFLEEPFGEKTPQEIAPIDIDRLRIGLLKTKSPKTAANVIELLRRIVNFGIKRRLVPRVDLTFEMPKVSNQKTEALSNEEIQRLLTVIDAHPENPAGPIMKFALFTGMRRGEILRLRWEDVDLQTKTLTIRDAKSGRDESIPLNSAAFSLLASLPKRSEYVFPGRSGAPIIDLKKSIHKIARAAGLPEGFRCLHGLRHVYATILASAGVGLYHIQKLLTHKSAAPTQRYAHIEREALRQSAEFITKFLNGPETGAAIAKEAQN